MTIPLILMIVAICTTYIGITVIHIFYNKINIALLVKIVFGVYLICLIVLTLLTASSFSTGGLSIQKVSSAPWFGKEILLTFENITKSDAITNLIMFYPMGYLIAMLSKGSSKSKFLKGVGFGVLASFAIEFLQFALPILRAPSLSDLVFNSISAFVGAIVFLLVEKIIKK